MKKQSVEQLLHLKHSKWLLLPSSLSISSAVVADESRVSGESHHVGNIVPGLTHSVTELVTNLPMNIFAWFSLSAMMALLFLVKRRPSFQASVTAYKKPI